MNQQEGSLSSQPGYRHRNAWQRRSSSSSSTWKASPALSEARSVTPYRPSCSPLYFCGLVHSCQSDSSSESSPWSATAAGLPSARESERKRQVTLLMPDLWGGGGAAAAHSFH